MVGLGLGLRLGSKIARAISDFLPFSWGATTETWDDLDMITWEEMEP